MSGVWGADVLGALRRAPHTHTNTPEPGALVECGTSSGGDFWQWGCGQRAPVV